MTESSAPLRIVRDGWAQDSAVTDEPVADPAAQAAAERLINTLYADNAAFVISYVTGLLNDRFLAEDVLQETMLRAWRYSANFSEQKGSVRGWLIKVAHNIAMDKIRMRRSRPVEVAETAVPESMVEDHADAVVNSVHVQHALARLSPAHRQVVEQIYLHGRTAKEAAARLGIPEGTAFSRSYYAIRILRSELGVAEPADQWAADGEQAA
jgi:RNA polymerase sigma-70 factor (ECF subfamily)